MKFSMPLFKKSTKKEQNEICHFCKWKRKDHAFGIYCYHYSDQDSDIFYTGSSLENPRKTFQNKEIMTYTNEELSRLSKMSVEERKVKFFKTINPDIVNVGQIFIAACEQQSAIEEYKREKIRIERIKHEL